MSDAKIEQLQRAATQGGPAERRALLQALLRADRPLGDAWPDGAVSIRLDEPYRTDAVLDVLAQIDVPRLRDGLACHGAAFLADLGRNDLRASLDVETVRLSDYEYEHDYDHGTPRWLREGWRWRCDAPAYVRHLAASANGQHAAATWAGDPTIHRGSPQELVDASPSARWTPPEPLVALGFCGGDPVVVARRHVYVLAGEGEPVPRPLRFEATVAGVSGSGTVAVSDGKSVALLDPVTGRVLWREADLRVDGNRIVALVPGPKFLAVCSGDVRICSMADGAGLTTCKRGTFTKVWEDPESTMGLGRDRREYIAYDPDFVDAAWIHDLLVTVDSSGGVEGWRIPPTGRRATRSGKQAYRASPRQIVGSGTGLVASTRTLHAMGQHTWTRDVPAPAHALSACGEDRFLVGLRTGRVVVLETRRGL